MNGFVAVKKCDIALGTVALLKKDLTIHPLATSSFNGMPDPIRIWSEDDENVYVPRGYFNSVIRKLHDPKPYFIASNGANFLRPAKGVSYREGQKEIVDEAIYNLQLQGERSGFGGTIIEAGVASGKTLISLQVAKHFGLKILIVVHTSVLMEQWIEEIKKFYPEWSVGKIRAGVMDTKGNDVCVGMLQSLSMKADYPPEFFSEFGFIVFDELHTMASKEFSNALFRFNAKYLLGVSGTLKRADRADNVFHYGLGPVVRAMNKAPTLKAKIYFVDTKYIYNGSMSLDNYSYDKNNFLSKVINNDSRNSLIVTNVVNAVMKGRHVLILSERVDHVNFLYREIASKLIPKGIKVGMMIGKSTKEERKYSTTAQVLVATEKLLAVGFNNPRLDTLVFATPCQRVTQPVGRIVRLHDEKKDPLVIDFVDTTIPTMKVLARSRMRQYQERGWIVVNPEMVLGKPKQLLPPNASGGWIVRKG